MRKFYITGDTHGDLSRFNEPCFQDTNIIILGDSGFLYYDYLSRPAIRMREEAKRLQCIFYLVRGNHEDRPQNVPVLSKLYDDQIKGKVYVDENYTFIRYLIDGEVYDFNGQKCLILGGAYSVDKQYRLMRGWQWFEDEQLDTVELIDILNRYEGQHFDFILSHTCPYSWRPTHLFLSMIDQSTVDNTMEHYFDKYKEAFDFDMWLWGHYHENCVCDNRGVMLYDAVYDLAMCQPIDEYTEYDGDYMTWSPNYMRREDI